MADAKSPLVYGCYLVIVQDGTKTHSMVCSWGTQVSDRYILLCIGPQSETGKLLTVGRRFSVNVLLREQKPLALLAGTKHSSAVDKLAGVPLTRDGDVVLLSRAKKTMACRVERLVDVSPLSDVTGVVAEIVSPAQEQEGDAPLLDEVF